MIALIFVNRDQLACCAHRDRAEPAREIPLQSAKYKNPPLGGLQGSDRRESNPRLELGKLG